VIAPSGSQGLPHSEGLRGDVTDPSAPRDQGSVLTLVLVLTVIVSLAVLPTLTYAVTVLKANTVLSHKSHQLEGVKSGLRLALAEPVELYKACANAGQTVAVQLADFQLNGETISTKCYTLDVASAQNANELRLGLVTTRVPAAPPCTLGKDPLTNKDVCSPKVLVGNVFVPANPASTTEWQTASTPLSETDKIWLPNLPVHALSPRSPAGTPMAAGFPTCTVYFPGTYVDAVTLTGPTFFTSGIYYFEKDVRIQAGASVVVGDGAAAGCTTSQEAIFYAQNVPSTHNMTGLGGTWVLGADARVIVDNTAGPVSLRFNSRYSSPGDAGDAPSQDVSIVSVNGEMAADGVTGAPLDIPGSINVPLSLVGSDSPVSATSQKYKPSLVTPRPRVPAAPAGVTAQKYSGAAIVAWTAPFNGGSPITGYVVTASTGQTCATNGATTCAVRGLSTSASVNFSVVAANNVGSSPASVATANLTPNGSAMGVPSTPAAPSALPFQGLVRTSWTAPASTAPITRYTVTATPGGATCSVDMTMSWTPDLKCDISGLDMLTAYTFNVKATNAVGDSPTSPQSANVIPLLGLGAPPALAGPPAVGPFVPPAILDFNLSGTATALVDIPGYVSVPQGRVNVTNPNGQNVRISGGLLASQLDVNDSRGAGNVPIGFEEAVVQRKLRIVSTTSGGHEVSTAVVQINQNGAYAVNSWEVQ
jgi:hypothetical protein